MSELENPEKFYYPAEIELEAGQQYAWCTCGLSKTQPFCDGSHKTIPDRPFRSLKFIAQKRETVYLCQCKHTKNPPFCDGSHAFVRPLKP